MTKRERTPDIANLLGGRTKPAEGQQAKAPALEAKPKKIEETPGILSKPSKQDKQGPPSKHSTLVRPTPQAGLPEGWTRATFIVREESLELLKALAYYQRRQIKEVVDEALSKYLHKAETSEAMKLYSKSQAKG